MAHDMTTASPYEHCVLSGTDIIGPSHGYPDGDMQPSVTLDYKAVYTFKPVGGVIDVVLAPSANSAVVLLTGTAAAATLETTPAPTHAFGFNTSTKNVTKGPIQLQTVASVVNGLGEQPPNTVSDEFRPVVLVADFDYTGSSMMDNGSLTIQSIPNSEKLLGSQLVTASTNYNADKVVFSNPELANSISPAALTQPARESFTTRIVANEPKYEVTRPSVLVKGNTPSTDGSAYAWQSSVSTVGTLYLAPSYHSSCEWTRVTYSGLDSSASITVTIRYCVQFSVNQSSDLYGPLAQPSPAAKPSIVTKVANFARIAPIAVKKNVKVWDIFRKIGKAVLPIALPGAGGVISSFL